MPINFAVASHPANQVGEHAMGWPPPVTDPGDLLARTWRRKNRSTVRTKLIQSSLDNGPGNLSNMYPTSSGFINTVMAAYNAHHHLSIRPDDVWMAILSQFNLYVNAHSEELRAHFVEHEGKKDLIVDSIEAVAIAQGISKLLHENLIDKELKTWILPDFSTTTHLDTVICAMHMMSSLKAYFKYRGRAICGIPSVTLEGEKSDWKAILARVNKLKEFGAEPEAWACLLRPILTRFVRAFEGKPDIDFWGQVCHKNSRVCGGVRISGWITAFAVWDDKGRWQGPSLTVSRPVPYSSYNGMQMLVLDGVKYGVVNIARIPPGLCEVDVKLVVDTNVYECMMVSGHMATEVYGEKRDGVRPFPSWFMFVKDSAQYD